MKGLDENETYISLAKHMHFITL